MIGLAVAVWHGPVVADTSLSLEAAIKLAQEHSYAIESSFHDSLAASQDLKSARSLRYPTAHLTAAAHYIDNLQSAEFPLGAREIGSRENYQADIRLTWPLYAGGAIAARIGMRLEESRSRSYVLDSERMKNAYLTRKAYLALMLSEYVVASAAASLERIRIISRDVQNRFINGMADSLDLLEAELAVQKGSLALDEKKTARDNAGAALARLLGLAPGENVIPSESAPSPDSAKYEARDVDGEILQKPELKALDSKIGALEFSARLARAGYFPEVNGYGGYSIGKPNRDLFNKSWNDFWIAGMTLSWKFNIGFQARAEHSRARETAEAARMSRKELAEILTLEAETALRELELAYRTYSVSVTEHRIAAEKFRLAGLKQVAGQISVNRLLEMEEDLTVAEERYRASIINYYLAETEYIFATGSHRIYGGL